MATETNLAHGATLGTVSGTALTIVVNIHSSDLLKTGILAGFGALISFGVTVFLKWLSRKFGN